MDVFSGKNKDDKDKKKESPKKKPNSKSQFTQNFIGVVVMFAILALIYTTIINDQGDKIEEIAISEVAELVKNGEVESIVVRGEKLEIFLNDEEETEKKSKKEREASLTETLVNYDVSAEQLNNANIDIKNENGIGFWIANFLPFLVPILFLVLFFWFISRQVKGPGMKAFSFGQSKARVTDPDKQKLTFKDVAGAKEAKEELQEIVEFLSHPKKFLDIGAEIPKGVLLMGEPGTGKTLLARAVAGEAKVPFFHLSGSEFVEMFVGVGASRVRDLFNNAKKMAPAIIFIDEIDAVGRSRGIGVGGGNDEREQTLNQILVEMDGFEPNQKLIVIAATNRPDVLDPALLRPGRFDRRVMVDPPDRKDREAILKIHARKKPLAEDVNLEVIAERTPTFTGADLYSVMNEAAILAAREDRKKVAQFDLIRSIEKVMIGPERKSHMHTDKERKMTAYHEAGHALVASVMPHADPVHKLTIISRGRAGGYMLSLPLEEEKYKSKKTFLDNIAMALGGYVAEKMIFDDVSTGPSSDLQKATADARNMVTRWGMSDKIGPIALETREGTPLYGRTASHEYSDSVLTMIDEEVSRIIQDGLKRAEKALTDHRDALDAIVEALLDQETLEQEEYNAIIERFGIKPKKKKKKEPAASPSSTSPQEDSTSQEKVEKDDSSENSDQKEN